jgi:predicted RNA-binding Zn ribbon-like protein
MPVSTENKAPHGLDLVIEFVNTADFETGIDELATRDGLARWLADNGLIEGEGASVTEREREQAIALREALRAVMLAHNAVETDADAGQELERVARHGLLSVQFTPGGEARVTARATGFAGALAQLLIPVAQADADGSWLRVKSCRAEDCHWAFFDHSRNRAGVWCDMAVCGNRTKVRAYRSRQPPRR